VRRDRAGDAPAPELDRRMASKGAASESPWTAHFAPSMMNTSRTVHLNSLWFD